MRAKRGDTLKGKSEIWLKDRSCGLRGNVFWKCRRKLRMDEQKREERNAHTVENAGGGELEYGVWFVAVDWGPVLWITGPRRRQRCSALTSFLNCLNTLNTEEYRRSLWVYFHRGTGQGVGEGLSATQRNSKPGSEGCDLGPTVWLWQSRASCSDFGS